MLKLLSPQPDRAHINRGHETACEEKKKKLNGGRDCACPLPSACPAGNPFIIRYVWTKSRVFIKEICSDPSIFSSSWKQAVKLLQRASLSTFNLPSIKLKTQLGFHTGEQVWSQIMKPKPKKTNRLNKTVTSWLDWEVLVKHKICKLSDKSTGGQEEDIGNEVKTKKSK